MRKIFTYLSQAICLPLPPPPLLTVSTQSVCLHGRWWRAGLGSKFVRGFKELALGTSAHKVRSLLHVVWQDGNTQISQGIKIIYENSNSDL